MAKPKKNKNKQKINLTLREEQRNKLEQMAAIEKRSVSNLIEVMADERWERLAERQGALIIYRRGNGALPLFYCVKFFERLRAHDGNQMAQLVFNVAGQSHCVSDLFAQQRLVSLTKSIERLFDRILSHIEFVCDLGLRWAVRFIHEHFLHLLEEPHSARAAIFISQSHHHWLKYR